MQAVLDSHNSPGSVCCSQSDLDLSLKAALCSGSFRPSNMQRAVLALISPASSLGSRMRKLCTKYQFVISPITVGVDHAEEVLGVVMLHFFTHSERHRLRVGWRAGGVGSPASVERRRADPDRWASNCWDLVRRTLVRCSRVNTASQIQQRFQQQNHSQPLS